MAVAEVGDLEEQFVIFDVGDETFGIDISKVQEIIRIQTITQVPGAPGFVVGVINLRGKIIPVVDLHQRFGLPPAENNGSSRIVVVESNGNVLGMVVDAVSEVERIPNNCVEPPSSVVASADSDYIKGIAKLETRLIILLELDQLLAG